MKWEWEGWRLLKCSLYSHLSQFVSLFYFFQFGVGFEFIFNKLFLNSIRLFSLIISIKSMDGFLHDHVQYFDHFLSWRCSNGVKYDTWFWWIVWNFFQVHSKMQYYVDWSGKTTWPTLLATRFSAEDKKIECGWKHELSCLNLPHLSRNGKLVNVKSETNEDLSTLWERYCNFEICENYNFWLFRYSKTNNSLSLTLWQLLIKWSL